MVQRPAQYGVFEFVVLAGLRTAQLSRGCVPRVPPAAKHCITAQLEVAAAAVRRQPVAEPLDGDVDIAPALDLPAYA